MLGRILLRRHPFVLISCVMLLLWVLLFVAGICFDEAFDRVPMAAWMTAQWCFMAAALLLAVLNWWLSYRMFRRLQVINDKWINL